MEKKGKTIETTVNLLPEPIIQHIQSFLNAKEAARTTLLSKPWYTAWLTRPSFDFDERNFKKDLDFEEFTAKTMQRYQDLNLKIECFRLNIRSWNISELLAHTLIVNAINIGATDLKLDDDDELRKLRTLCLEYMSVDNTFFNDFATRFPCLKELSLVECRGYTRIEMASTSLECIRIVQPPKKRKMEPEMKMDKFDVPNIGKFTYSCTSLPSLNINAGRCITTREWEFHLSIKCRHRYSAYWFLRLSRFLKRIRPSTIKLSLDLKSGPTNPANKKQGAVDNNNNSILAEGVALRNLTIKVPSEYRSALLDCVKGILLPQVYFSRLARRGMLVNIELLHLFSRFGLNQIKTEILITDKWRRPVCCAPRPQVRNQILGTN